jgi:hypothetical protein
MLRRNAVNRAGEAYQRDQAQRTGGQMSSGNSEFPETGPAAPQQSVAGEASGREQPNRGPTQFHGGNT